ncbi:MAG: hypothetical protein JXO48_04030 [Deltaproteobacteria bacterium]|nr:hypothetical protein [Deltaproteobacteria bacterium]
MTESGNRGVIDAMDRVIGRLLEKPNVKENLRILLANIDPESARGLVRTMLWRDAEVFLGVLGALPSILNAFIKGYDEMLIQVREKFPPELLRSFMRSLAEDIDRESLSRAEGNTRVLIEELLPVVMEVLREQGSGSASGEEERQS